MSAKLIHLPHRVCGLTCMINGVEDLYEQKTGVRLPERLLFYLSGMAGFVYVKNRNAPTPRMVFWGMQVAKYQYAALADVVGFTLPASSTVIYCKPARRCAQGTHSPDTNRGDYEKELAANALAPHIPERVSCCCRSGDCGL